MLRDVTIGQFFPGNGVLHKMDPRVKIILLMVFIILIFCASSIWSLLLCTLVSALIVVLSSVPVKMYLKSLKMIIFIILFTSILNLFYGTGTILFQFGFLKITTGGINNCIFVVIRILSLILVSSSLTFTTSPTDLTDAIEHLMKPLEVFHLKVHEIAMMMTIALRFIPTLLEETDKIMQAQKARGADMESGNLIQKIKALIPVLIPLFISAFRRAYDLATAMECRCYQGGAGRTRMKTLHMGKIDLICILFVLLVLLGVIICNVFFPLTLQ